MATYEPGKKLRCGHPYCIGGMCQHFHHARCLFEDASG